MPRPVRMCFIVPNACALFDPSAGTQFGGAEVRAYLFGNGLARDRGYEVSFVVGDYGQQAVTRHASMTVYAHPGYLVNPAGPPHGASSRARHLFAELTQTGGVVEHTDRFPYRRFRTRDPQLLLKYAVAHWHKFIEAVRLRWNTRRGIRLRIRNYAVPRIRNDIYERIGADIYAAFGVHNLAGEIAAYCHQRERQFVLFLADLVNLDERYRPDMHGRDVYGSEFHVCHYAIQNADMIVAQLETQRHLLQQRFGKTAVVIRNPIALPPDEAHKVDGLDQREYALWVGRADNFKKMPMLLIELAQACPDVPFVMVMNDQNQAVKAAVVAACPPNVIIYDRRSYHEMDALFARAFAFVSTSRMEGFPNTFLQAGRHGVPVLSLNVDPDGFIERYNCGIVAHGRFDELVRGLCAIRNDWTAGQRFSRHIRAYVQQHHELTARVNELDSALTALRASRPQRVAQP